METVVRIIFAVARALVHDHHVRKLEIEELIECGDSLFQDHGEVAPFRVVKIRERETVALRINVRLIRVAREERNHGDEAVVLCNDAAFVARLFRDDVCDQVAVRSLEVSLALFEFTIDARRHERKAVNLTVRVMQRNTDRFAFVLEDKDVIDEIARFQFAEAIRPDADELVYLFDGFFREARIMIRRVNDHLADALTGCDRVKLCRFDRRSRRLRS